jgi:hypothetical protein
VLELKHQLSQEANIDIVHHELLFESVVVPLSLCWSKMLCYRSSKAARTGSKSSVEILQLTESSAVFPVL